MATLIKRVGEPIVIGKECKAHGSFLLTSKEIVKKRKAADNFYSRKTALTNKQVRARKKSAAAKKARKAQR